MLRDQQGFYTQIRAYGRWQDSPESVGSRLGVPGCTSPSGAATATERAIQSILATNSG